VPDSWIGRTVGNCRIEEKIGEGGCGEVYRGVDLMLDRSVAIKVLHPRLAARRDLAERFRSEALTLARLSHPNVATLYSFHQEGDASLMVMEFVRGKTFDALLRERGRMSPDEALPLFLQALDGIEHAHRLGVIHRDLKGSNVMRADTGGVKVMDFGIARALGSPGLTQADHPIGTPEYMPPEQVRAEEIDARADVYALGALLFKMLTGRLPFTGRSHFDVLRAQVEEVPPTLREVVPELPAALDAVVARALAKSPDERFQGVAELRRALEEAWGGAARTPEQDAPTQVLARREPVRAEPTLEDLDPRTPTLELVRGRPSLVRLGVGALAVALTVLLVWLGARRSPSGPPQPPASIAGPAAATDPAAATQATSETPGSDPGAAGDEPLPVAELGPMPAPRAEAAPEAAAKSAPKATRERRARPAGRRGAVASAAKTPAARQAGEAPGAGSGWRRETAPANQGAHDEEPRDRWLIRRQ
jgi:serine/threonine-protein kinase